MTTASRFDADLLRRYDRPGPRYTSYPTAPHFDDAFGEAEFRDYAARSNGDPIPRSISLYVHVPYCFSPCFYCGCNRIITRDLTKGERYLERLLCEIECVAPLFDRDREVVQVHFGGGTPNFLSPEQLDRLLSSMGRHFHFSSAADRDFSIELDPRYVDEGDIAAYAALGFNRASLGVQDFNPDVQKAVNRVQSIKQTRAVIDACRAQGLRSVNIDLIYGLPRQTIDGFRRTLDTVIDARPNRLAVYGYAHLPSLFKAQRQIKEDELPDGEGRLALLQLAVEELTAAGFCYIGMDHFALPDDDLARAQAEGDLHRNFMGYTTHADCDLVGVGVSAISHVGDSYSQNPRDLTGWEIALDQGRLPVWRGMALTFDDVLRADVIQQLMCQGEVDIVDTARRFNINFPDYFSDCRQTLADLARDGLVTVNDSVIAATSRGRYLMRIIAMCFDRYLNSTSSGDVQARYSRAI